MNAHGKTLAILLAFAAFLSCSCGGAPTRPPEATAFPSAPPTAAESTLTSPPPSVTPTPLELPLSLAGTPIQVPSSAISADTLSRVDQLGRWGKGYANQVAVAPGGGMAAVAASVGVYLYSLPSLDLMDFVETGAEEKSAVFTPDGKTLATGSGNGFLVFWDVSHGRLERLSAVKNGSRINTLAVSPDGTQVAVAAHGITFRSLPDGEFLFSLTDPHEGWVSSILYSADGNSLYSGARDGFLKKWSTADGSLEAALLDGGPEINVLASSPDGNLAVGSTDGSVRILDPAAPGRAVSLGGHTGWVNSLAFSPDGSLLASGGYGDPIKVWRASDGSLVREIGEKSLVDVRTMAFLPDGSGLLSASDNGMLTLWQVADGAVLASAGEHDIKVDSLAFSSDNGWLAVGLDSGLVQIRRLPLGTLESTDSGGGIHVTSVAFSPDGSRLAAGSWPFNIKLWDWSEAGLGKKIIATTNTPDGPPVTFTPDGKWLVTMYPGMLMHRDARNGGEHHFLHGDILGESSTYAFSADGSLAAWGTKDGRVYVLRVSDRTVIAIPVGNPSEVFSLVFSPQGNLLAAGYRDGSVQVWVLPGGAQIYHLTTIGPDYKCYSCETPVQFSPDGLLLVTGSVEGTIGIWSAVDGSPLAVLRGHTGAVIALAFSSDGVYLASGAQDGTVRIWGPVAE